MTATAAKSDYGTWTGYANHSELRLTRSGYERGYKTAKPAVGRQPNSQPSLSDDEARRAGYLRAAKPLHAGDKVVVMKAIVRGNAFQLIGASAVELPKPEPPAPRQTTPAPQAEQIPSAKAFAMQ